MIVFQERRGGSCVFVFQEQTCLPLRFRCNSYGFRPQIPLLRWLGQKLQSLSDFSFPALVGFFPAGVKSQAQDRNCQRAKTKS